MADFINEDNPLNRARVSSLPTGYPLNDIRKTGIYYVNNPVNGPSSGDYVVTVLANQRSYGEAAVQTAVKLADGAMYVRVRQSTGWDAWAAIGSGGGGGGGGDAGDITYDPATGSPVTLDYIASAQSPVPDLITTFSIFGQALIDGSPIANNVEEILRAVGVCAIIAYNYSFINQSSVMRYRPAEGRDPTPNDDFSKSYDRAPGTLGTITLYEGHLWYNNVGKKLWICTDNGNSGGAGTAVWQQILLQPAP